MCRKYNLIDIYNDVFVNFNIDDLYDINFQFNGTFCKIYVR
jgi:hypothetical protein